MTIIDTYAAARDRSAESEATRTADPSGTGAAEAGDAAVGVGGSLKGWTKGLVLGCFRELHQYQ